MVTEPPFDDRLAAVFRREQVAGLVLALQGRLVVLAILAVAAANRPVPLVYYTLAGIAGFAILGALQLWLVRRPGAPLWIPYLFAAIDVLALTIIVVAFSAPTVADLPTPIAYRFDSFLYFFLVVAVAAFAYSPGLVLWTGLFGAICWGAGAVFVWATEPTLSFGDVSEPRSRESFLRVFLDPTFFGQASRVTEVLILSGVALLLAAVMTRARRVVIRQAQAERENRRIVGSFGRYVPEAVARAIVEEDGRILKPGQREATVLFTDIAGFTRLSETMDPVAVVEMLNAYFDAVAKVIGRHGGVITQFQGDAVLATYNLPLADPDHARAAVRTALDLVALAGGRTFAGISLQSRIGINSGLMVAGNVGSAGRLNYTVHGDAVNLAARFEVLNKTYGTRMLVGERTVALAGDTFRWRLIGSVVVDGRREPLSVFTVDAPA